MWPLNAIPASKPDDVEMRYRKPRWEFKMPFIYTRVDSLQLHEKVGTKQCVALIQAFTGAGNTSSWRQGARVLDNKDILKGTAIATFVRGIYPNHAHGNHAAFFLRHGPKGFWVMDQWADPIKELVSSRFIPTRGKSKDGTFVRPSDNADAYSIIEPN